MKTLGEFINELATKAGIKADNEELVGLLAAPILQQLTVPEKIEQGINNNLLSIDAAKNNHPALKSHYFAAAYDGLDRELDTAMDELELDDEIRTEIKKERSSTKRAAALAKKIRELEKQQAGRDTTPAETKELKKTIDQLHAELKKEKEGIASIKNSYEEKLKSIQLSHQLAKLISPHKTIYDELDADVRETTIMAIINKELQSNEGVLDLDDTGNLKLLKKDGSNFFGENHVQMNPQGFIERALAKNKILKQSGGSPAPAGTGTAGQGSRQQVAGSDDKKDYALKSLAEQALADLERASGSVL